MAENRDNLRLIGRTASGEELHVRTDLGDVVFGTPQVGKAPWLAILGQPGTGSSRLA